MMKYVYIDESGDLGIKPRSSKYFILAGFMIDNPKKIDNLIKNTYRKFKKISKMNEIKGTTAPEDVIKHILKKLNNIDYQSFIIVLDKKNINKIDYNNDVNFLYDLLSSLLSNIIPIDSKTVIFIDKTKNKKQIMNFNKSFRSNFNNISIEINHVNSINYKGLQIADLISWSIYQYFEHENDEFMKLIKNKLLKKVFED